jgi:transposase-like protein
MEEKLRFVYDYEREEGTMWDLCSRFGVSRETGYVWLRRYREQGARGLVELDRAARRHPNQTSPDVERAVVELRGAHMRWGPRKLKRILSGTTSSPRSCGESPSDCSRSAATCSTSTSQTAPWQASTPDAAPW